MALFEKGNRWNGWVALSLCAGSGMGGLNSMLQLGRYGSEATAQFAPGELTMISVWLGLLVFWSILFGLVAGVFVARQWFSVDAGADRRSMAPSD